MCRPGALLPGLLLALLAGCANGPSTRPTGLVERLLGGQLLPPNAVQMEVAVLERPLGDPYLSKDLWAFTDEQVVDLEHKAALEDNGFRVGQVVGMTPSGMQSLLTSDRACINPRRYLLGPGKAAPLALGATVPHSQFHVVQGGETLDVSLDEVQFSVVVLPALTADGRTRLHFTPQVQYGENLRDIRVAPDASGYVMEIKRPCQTYPALGWDVTLRPSQYVIIGPRLDQPDKLGARCFVQSDGPCPVQRLLVIRTNRAAGGTDEENAEEALAEESTSKRAPPLALQATWSAARGSAR